MWNNFLIVGPIISKTDLSLDRLIPIFPRYLKPLFALTKFQSIFFPSCVVNFYFVGILFSTNRGNMREYNFKPLRLNPLKTRIPSRVPHNTRYFSTRCALISSTFHPLFETSSNEIREWLNKQMPRESSARFYRANAQGRRVPRWKLVQRWRKGWARRWSSKERGGEETGGGVKRSTWRERSFERGTKRGRAVSKIIGTLSGSLRVRSETIIWGRPGQK